MNVAFGEYAKPKTLNELIPFSTTFAQRQKGCQNGKHIDVFEVINMNGRIYDPRLGRFLSPDPYVQAPDFSQSFNRYSYVWNNPMKYVDPSGYRTVSSNGFAIVDPWGVYTPPYLDTGGNSGSNWLNASGGLPGGGIGAPGQGFNGPGYGGIYYDWYSGTYQSTSGLGQMHWKDAYNALIPFGKTYRYGILGGYVVDPGPCGYDNAARAILFYGWYDASDWDNSLGSNSNNAWIGNSFDANTGLGAVTGIIGNNYGLTRNHTYRYASGGKSAQQLTKLHFAHSMKVANFLGKVNIATGVIGVGFSLYNISEAYNTGNPINPWDVSDAAVGSVGVGAGLATFLVTNPVGWTVAAGIGLGAGVYFGFRLIHDLSTND